MVAKLTSLSCLRRHDDFNTLCRTARYSGIKANAMMKINVWKSNGMQEKESILEQSLVMPNNDHQGGFFHPLITPMILIISPTSLSVVVFFLFLFFSSSFV